MGSEKICDITDTNSIAINQYMTWWTITGININSTDPGLFGQIPKRESGTEYGRRKSLAVLRIRGDIGERTVSQFIFIRWNFWYNTTAYYEGKDHKLSFSRFVLFLFCSERLESDFLESSVSNCFFKKKNYPSWPFYFPSPAPLQISLTSDRFNVRFSTNFRVGGCDCASDEPGALVIIHSMN